ncbi:glycosyl hydrolase 53 family protein [Algibacillus agarilyticus]|uniref:glycosyl hydrolase 53 family protein n=1 Tax=Algibacillus agarilyticus TaxID=2234133 RepID=UPI000DD0ED0F|nr:glycosyl hydrolase 53 family protein [Algibacillus agarilyticus]
MNKKALLVAAILGSSSLLSSGSAFANAKGADISWLSEMKDNNYIFYNDNGVEQDVITTLKQHGMDSVRLRVWVNPADGFYSGIDDVVAKAVEAQNAGMRIMIDFHYSDTWADPGHQTKPSEWASYTAEGLTQAVWWHTYDSLNAIKAAGVTPEWVQVGNETNNGMLWGEGKASENMQAFTWLVNSGHDATKAVFPDSKVIVHLANCHDNANFRWIFDGLNSYGGKYDVIGASDYPTNVVGSSWQTVNQQCLANLNDMVSRYDKDVMITEIGVPWDNADAEAILRDMIDKLDEVQDSRSLGVFYWEPQASNFNGYTLGAWDPNTRKPTGALDAFIDDTTPTATTNRIRSRISDRCIDVNGARKNNGEDILQWSCHNNDNQQWTFNAVDSGYYQIQAKHSGLCLDIESASDNDGANVIQWTCKDTYNQQFIKEDMGDGYFRLKSRASGKCIDIYAQGTSNGDSAIQWSCHDGWNQQWKDD